MALRLPHPHVDQHPGLQTLSHVLWAVGAAVVLLFIFFAALDVVHPGDAEVLTGVVLVLAALWLVHAWRDLWRAERRG